MSTIFIAPPITNPYIGVDMSNPQERAKYIDWMHGAGDRYAHAHGPQHLTNAYYMEGYLAESTNGDFSK